MFQNGGEELVRTLVDPFIAIDLLGVFLPLLFVVGPPSPVAFARPIVVGNVSVDTRGPRYVKVGTAQLAVNKLVITPGGQIINAVVVAEPILCLKQLPVLLFHLLLILNFEPHLRRQDCSPNFTCHSAYRRRDGSVPVCKVADISKFGGQLE